MQTLLTHKTASLTDLRDPANVLSQAGNTPVAVMRRNTCVGYFVPISAVEKIHFEKAADTDVMAVLAKRMPHTKATTDYLQDK